MNILITGGMDWDEYAGIEAARLLRVRYRSHKNITVFPLDYVPTDGKLPKTVFPGNTNGTETERKMHILYETYVKKTDIWIDLHGGATNEILTPFMWLYQSKHADIRAMHQRIIDSTSAPIVIYDRQPFMRYSSFLDSHHIAHILLECGDQGDLRKTDVTMLMRWVDEIIFPTQKHYGKPAVYTSVQYVFDVSKHINAQLLWKRTDTDIKRGEVAAAYAQP